MATKKPSPAMEFVVAALKKEPEVEYGAVRDAAANKGLTIFPIMYGRAKALLGLVPVAPRGSKKKAAKAAKAAKASCRKGTPARRGPGRRRAGDNPIESLQAMISDMESVRRERDRYHRALEQIGRILESAL